MLAPTAPGQPLSEPLPAEEARERIAGLIPEPYAPDRAALAAALEKALAGKTGHSVVWLSDGLDYGDGESFAANARQACRRRRQPHRTQAGGGRSSTRLSANPPAKAACSPAAC